MANFQPDLSVFQTLMGSGVQAQTPADWNRVAAQREQAEAAARQQAAEERKAAAAAEKAAQDMRRAARVRELAAKHNGDPDKIVEALQPEDPELAFDLGKQISDWRKSTFEALKSENEAERQADATEVAELEAIGEDPVAYAAWRAKVVQRDPDKAALLPEQYDPVRIGNFYKTALTVDQIRQQRQHSIDMAVKGEWHQAVAMALDDPEVDTPEEHDATLRGMRTQGAPPHILAQFKIFDPDPVRRTARLRMLGQTPEQRAKGGGEGALVQVEGPDGTAIWATREEARGKPVGTRPASEGALVQVVGPNGVVTWQTREQAEGQRAPRPESGGSGGEKAATPTARLTATMTLQNRYNTQTKAAQTSATAVSQMRESIKAVKNGSMAAGSQGVLVTFQKLLDPTSVVRESEYDRSAAGQAMMARLQGQYDRIVSGGAGIPVAELEKFVSLAEAYNRNAQLSASRLKQQFDSIATDFGLNPAHITRELDEEAPTPAP